MRRAGPDPRQLRSVRRHQHSPLRAAAETCGRAAQVRRRVLGSIATLMVRARSCAEIPVVTPSRASIASQKAVRTAMCSRWSWAYAQWSSRSSVMARQTRPRPWCHEVDRFGSDFFRGEREVTFVLAVLVVNHDDHSSRADLFDCGGTSVNGELGVIIYHAALESRCFGGASSSSTPQNRFSWSGHSPDYHRTTTTIAARIQQR